VNRASTGSFGEGHSVRINRYSTKAVLNRIMYSEESSGF
jgi:hypothetical protein